MAIKIRTAEEWKGSELCEAVLTSIMEIYEDKGLGTSSAKIEEIEKSIINHPNCSSENILDCLENPMKDSYHETVTVDGGYQIL